MALTKQQAEKRLADACEMLKLELEVNYVGKQRNVPAVPFWGFSPDKHTVHETANPNVGADARSHRKFVKNGGGSELASYTASVDSKRLVLILPLTDANYHAGTNPGNMDSMSIETCVNKDGDWAVTKDNLAKANAAMLHVWGLPVAAMVQHNIWYGKDCPMKIRHEGSWGTVVQNTVKYLTELNAGVPVPEPVDPPYILKFPGIVPYTVQHGFKDLWVSFKDRALEVCGYPISEEYSVTREGIAVTAQEFENVTFEYHPGIQPRIGASNRRYRALLKAHPELAA